MKLEVCGGCNAKIAAGSLDSFLNILDVFKRDEVLLGFEKNEDAAVIKLTDDLCVVITCDFFPPMVEDPFMFGEIAAANALSDIYAMGAKPICALNLVCFPEEEDKNILNEILKGGANKLREAKVSLVGGHSIHDSKIKYGMCVLGTVEPSKIYKNNSSRLNDKLILTKPLGVGLLTNAMSVGECSDNDFLETTKSMRKLNKYALEILKKYDVSSLTDVTGFGLIGHLCEMINESAIINSKDIKLLSGAKKCVEEFLFTSGAQRNRNSFINSVDFENNDFVMEEILFDPQTSGGLLISVSSTDADELLKELLNNDIEASIIGEIIQKQSKKIIVR